MSHILLGSVNQVGLGAVRAALEAGHEVSMVTTDDLERLYLAGGRDPVLDRVRIVKIRDYSDVDELTEAVARIHAARPVDAGIPIFEASSLPLTQACARLSIPSTSAAAVALARDKIACRRRLAEAGVDAVPCALVQTPEDALRFGREHGFPVVLKPNRGLGSLGVRIAHTPAEAEDFFANHRREMDSLRHSFNRELTADDRVIAEGFISGTLCSVEIGIAADGFKRLAVSRRKRQRADDVNELGSTIPGVDDPEADRALGAQVERILTVLGFDRGLFHVEVILDERERATLVEVNPRLMGGTLPRLYRLATGVDAYDLLIRIFLGEPIGEVPPVRGAVASRIIGARRDGTVRADLPPDWIRAFEPELAFHDIPVRAGQAVPELRHNFLSVGQFMVAAEDPRAADAKADDILLRMEQALGIDLCR